MFDAVQHAAIALLNVLSVWGLALMDFLLGWMLHLPLGVSLALVAVGTAAILTFIRPLVTDQKTLHRCKEDKKRLKELMAQAKAAQDKDALARHRGTMAQIAMRNMKAEFWPLIASLVPIALLCVWSFARLGYVPPQPGAPIEVKATFAAPAIDKMAYIVPQDGITVEGGWIRRVAVDQAAVSAPASANASGAATAPAAAATQPASVEKSSGITGVATWTVRAQARSQPYVLTLRCGDETCTKELIVDGRRYAAVAEVYPNHTLEAVQLAHVQYRPWGFVPGIPRLHLDPWIVGYLIIAMPLAFALRYMFNIC